MFLEKGFSNDPWLVVVVVVVDAVYLLTLWNAELVMNALLLPDKTLIGLIARDSEVMF